MRLSHFENICIPGTEAAETNAIRALSARLSRNRMLVQASSGNTSVKIGDTLWMKASGKWFADAASPDFLIPVVLARAQACLKDGRTIPETVDTGGPRASIETGMHAALPQRVVVHVHSVNAIAWAVRDDAPNALRDCLDRFAWQWIPYTISGAPLARRVGEAWHRHPLTNVFLLGNHGLVVCGETSEEVERLLEEVERCLRLEARPAATDSTDIAFSASELRAGWVAPECPSIHGLARDALSRSILKGGVLYPCQALFLPSTVGAGERPQGDDGFPLYNPNRPAPVLLDADRVLCSAAMTQSEREMLFGLSDVVRRIYPSTVVRYLSASEVEGVLEGGGQYLAIASSQPSANRELS